MARVVLGLRRGDAAAVVQEYADAGYRACWHGGEPHGAAGAPRGGAGIVAHEPEPRRAACAPHAARPALPVSTQ